MSLRPCRTAYAATSASRSNAYDEEIRRFIPGYEEMFEVAAEAVAPVPPSLVVDVVARRPSDGDVS